MKSWPEKWNYSYTSQGIIGEDTKTQFTTAQIYQNYEVSSLVWNKDENNFIRKAVQIVNFMLHLDGFKSIKVYREQIVVLEKNVFDEKVSEGDHSALYSNGYVYVCRNPYKAKFLCDLAHELSHLISYYALMIEERFSNGADERSQIVVEANRIGYSFLQKNGTKLYVGLNEAVTEMYSKWIIDLLILNHPNLLTAAEKKYALSCYSYAYHAFSNQ